MDNDEFGSIDNFVSFEFPVDSEFNNDFIGDFDSVDVFDVVTEEFIESIIEEPTQQKAKRKRVTKNYINNEDFCNAVINYNNSVLECQEKNLAKPRLPNYIGECFMKLAEGISRKPNFYSYSYKDIMVSDALENCLAYLANFDPIKSRNAFAYFSQYIFYSFLRTIRREKIQQYVKYKATENFGVLDEAELMELGDGEIKQLEVYDNMYNFIENFERTEAERKAKTKAVSKANEPKGLDLLD